tara:strand:- start:10 stop:390 length:381 start_codon:yes stop_codon:yes gene_type:complete
MGLTSGKCNSRNPAPPCGNGYEENVRTLKDGSQYKCCFRLKTLKKKSSCSKRNPLPPCKEGYEIQTIGKDGEKTSCCYKAKTVKKSDCGIRNPKPPCGNLNRRSIFPIKFITNLFPDYILTFEFFY